MFSGEILHSRTDIFQREFDFLRFSLFRLSPKTANLFLWLSYGGVCFSYCAVHTVHTLAWKSASWDDNKVVLFTRCNCKGSNSHEISQNTTTGKPPHLQATDLYPPRNAQKFIVYTREANEQPNYDDDVIVATPLGVGSSRNCTPLLHSSTTRITICSSKNIDNATTKPLFTNSTHHHIERTWSGKFATVLGDKDFPTHQRQPTRSYTLPRWDFSSRNGL